MGFAEFEEVDRAGKVVFDELAGAGLAVHASEDTGIGGGVDDPIHGGEGLKVAGGAEISVEDFDAEFFEFGAVGFAAGPDEVVEAAELMTRTGGGERAGERAADEAADAGDENTHGRRRLRRLDGVGRKFCRSLKAAFGKGVERFLGNSDDVLFSDTSWRAGFR